MCDVVGMELALLREAGVAPGRRLEESVDRMESPAREAVSELREASSEAESWSGGRLALLPALREGGGGGALVGLEEPGDGGGERGWVLAVSGSCGFLDLRELVRRAVGTGGGGRMRFEVSEDLSVGIFPSCESESEMLGSGRD